MHHNRYARLERYAPLAATLPAWRVAHCAVVGLGGLGGGLAQQLARFGVASLTLIDRDAVGHENLGHQSLFTAAHADAALPKVHAAAEVLAAINPDVELRLHASTLDRRSISELLEGCTLLFDGLDNYYGRLLLNDYARKHELPYFYAGVVRGELSARAVLPGLTGCLRCLVDRPPAAGETPTCSAEGVFPPLLGVANALQLEAANRWLAGGAGFQHVEDGGKLPPPQRADKSVRPTKEIDILYSLTLPEWNLRKIELSGPRADCPACHGRYQYLDGTLDLLADSACAEGRAELTLADSVDLPRVEQTLADSGFTVRGNALCLRAERGELRYTLFPGGRVVQEGSGEAEVLARFVNTYLGV